MSKPKVLEDVENLELQVEGINTQLNEMATDVGTHKTEKVTDVDGVHGLKIESGTFTPIIAGSTVAGSNTYNRQVGAYHKTGDKVHCEMSIILSAKDANMGGIFQLEIYHL